MDFEILIISILAALTIVSAFKAHKYKTECRLMAKCFKNVVGREVTVEELRDAAKDDLSMRFR